MRALFAPPRPRIALGPVEGLLWQHAVPFHGLPVLLRCLAAWWRLPEQDALTAAHSPAALAAALERMISQRAARPRARYAEAAAAYRVPESAMRAAGPDLQRQLALSKSRLW